MKKLRTLVLVLAVLLSVLAYPSIGACDGVLVVRSAPVQVYDEAIRGFLQSFSSFRPTAGVKSIASPTVRQFDVTGPESEPDPNGRIDTLRPDLIVAVGAKALAAVSYFPGPVVSLMVGDPDSITKVSSSVTGVRMTSEPAELLGAIRTSFPAFNAIGILYDPGKSKTLVGSLLKAVQSVPGISLAPVEVTEAKAVHAALAHLENIDAILLVPDTTVITAENLDIFSLFSLKNKKPILAFAPQYLKRGCAAAIYATPESMGRQAARMAVRLLTVEPFEAIPPEESQSLTVEVNNRILQLLGIETTLERPADKE